MYFVYEASALKGWLYLRELESALCIWETDVYENLWQRRVLDAPRTLFSEAWTI